MDGSSAAQESLAVPREDLLGGGWAFPREGGIIRQGSILPDVHSLFIPRCWTRAPVLRGMESWSVKRMVSKEAGLVIKDLFLGYSSQGRRKGR